MNEPVQTKQGYARREANRAGWKAEIRQLRCENKTSFVATSFDIKAPYHGPRRFYVLNIGISTLYALKPADEALGKEISILRYTDLLKITGRSKKQSASGRAVRRPPRSFRETDRISDWQQHPKAILIVKRGRQ